MTWLGHIYHEIRIFAAADEPRRLLRKRSVQMSRLLNDQELSELTPAELLEHRTPIPTQVVASDEFYPSPQNEKQREVEVRLLGMADEFGTRQGLDRRAFFRSAAGMATSFLAMNNV